MASHDRERIFHEFHKRAGLRPFAPEFIDSLIAVMRDPNASLIERVFAWARWRAWGNSFDYAVSDWDPGLAKFLDQLDCAVDLAWFEEGKPIQWVEGAPSEFRKKARGGSETPRLIKDKSKISKAFSKNEHRGTIHFEGHRVRPVVTLSPVPEKKLTNLATFDGNAAFFEWWKVDDPGNSGAFEVARTAYYSARKIARTAYRRYKDQATSKADNLINEKALLNEPNPPSDGHTSIVVDTRAQSVRSVGTSFDPSLKSKIYEWLITNYKLPTAPGDDVLNAVTGYCKDEDGLNQLKTACERLKPRKWIVFVKMAKLCSEHRKHYNTANSMAAGSTSEKQRPRWAEGL